jgi:hypothetical protein
MKRAKSRRPSRLRALAEFSAELDRRFDAMQAPGAAAAMQRAFDTPPAELGAFVAASLRTPQWSRERG